MPSETPDSEWRRLHPLSPVVGALETVAGFAVPIVVILFFSRGSRFDLLILFSLVPSVAFAVARYLAFHYRLGDEEIVVREGIFRRTVRHVPYERIQNLDLSRSVVQRVFGLSQLSLETASGTEPEAVFRWVAESDVREIEAQVTRARNRESRDRPTAGSPPAPGQYEPPSGRRTGDPGHGSQEPAGPLGAPGNGPVGERPAIGGADGPATTLHQVPLADGPATTLHQVPLANGPATTLHQVPLSDLVLLGFFSLRGFALFAAVAGLGWQFGLFENPSASRWLKAITARWTDLASVGLAAPIAAALALLALVAIVSIVLTVIEGYDFRLSDAGQELRTRVGLFTQHASTIPKDRIQILEFLAPLHLRPFDRVRLWAGTAGGRARETAGRSWLLPIIHRNALGRVLASVQPVAILPSEAWLGVHPMAARRMRRRAVLWILIFTGLLFWRVGSAGLLALLLAPIAWVYAERTARHLGYAITEEAIFARHGWLYRRTQIVRLSKIQSAAVSQSPFDRRWQMATLEVDTASPSKGQLHVPYLPMEIAMQLQHHLSAEASRRRFLW